MKRIVTVKIPVQINDEAAVRDAADALFDALAAQPGVREGGDRDGVLIDVDLAVSVVLNPILSAMLTSAVFPGFQLDAGGSLSVKTDPAPE